MQVSSVHLKNKIIQEKIEIFSYVDFVPSRVLYFASRAFEPLNFTKKLSHFCFICLERISRRLFVLKELFLETNTQWPHFRAEKSFLVTIRLSKKASKAASSTLPIAIGLGQLALKITAENFLKYSTVAPPNSWLIDSTKTGN